MTIGFACLASSRLRPGAIILHGSVQIGSIRQEGEQISRL